MLLALSRQKSILQINNGKRNHASYAQFIKLLSYCENILLKRTPAWADLEAITQFYIDCPEGYEIDQKDIALI